MNLLFSPSKRTDRGQGLVEYAIIIALVAVIVIVVVRVVGPKVGNTFSTINNSLPGDTALSGGDGDDGGGDDGGGDDGGGTWTAASDEGSSFNLPAGDYEVQYGANGSYFYRYFTGPTTINCNNATFGDPIVGTYKSCSYR